MNLTEFKIRQLQRRVMVQSKATVLEVQKITSDTRAGGIDYKGEIFVLLDIYPKTNGTVNVTYGNLTKTITDTSGAEEPNAQQVFFGTFNGISDSVETPANGTLTIEGDYSAFGAGSFAIYNSLSKKEQTEYYSGVISVDDFGNINYIPNYAFYNHSGIEIEKLPEKITSIGDYAFYYCNNISFTKIPEGVKTIGNRSFYMKTASDGKNAITHLTSMLLPSTIKRIGESAFTYLDKTGSADEDECYLGKVEILATIPPELGANAFGPDKTIFVPFGCGETYRTATGWSNYEIKEMSE